MYIVEKLLTYLKVVIQFFNTFALYFTEKDVIS